MSEQIPSRETQYRMRVRAGIRFLDDRDAPHSDFIPADWRGEIDWPELDMAHYKTNVLEQLLSKCGVRREDLGLTGLDVVALGFDLPALEGSHYDLLTEVWVREVHR